MSIYVRIISLFKGLQPVSTIASILVLDLVQVLAMVSLVKKAIPSMTFAIRVAAVSCVCVLGGGALCACTSHLQTLKTWQSESYSWSCGRSDIPGQSSRRFIRHHSWVNKGNTQHRASLLLLCSFLTKLESPA
jgi:hypothetical protein